MIHERAIHGLYHFLLSGRNADRLIVEDTGFSPPSVKWVFSGTMQPNPAFHRYSVQGYLDAKSKADN